MPLVRSRARRCCAATYCCSSIVPQGSYSLLSQSMSGGRWGPSKILYASSPRVKTSVLCDKASRQPCLVSYGSWACGHVSAQDSKPTP
jgi:hypothetical protein